MKLPLLLAAVAALAVGPALASECVPSTTTAAIAVGDHYVYDPCLDPAAGMECGWWGPWSIWIYEESNGIAGLQRQDELQDDTCDGQIPGDTLIF